MEKLLAGAGGDFSWRIVFRRPVCKLRQRLSPSWSLFAFCSRKTRRSEQGTTSQNFLRSARDRPNLGGLTPRPHPGCRACPRLLARAPDRPDQQSFDVLPRCPGPDDSAWNLLWNSQLDVAAQMVYRCYDEPTYRVNGGVPGDPAAVLTSSANVALSYGVNYVEIYQEDVLNLPAVITHARNALIRPSLLNVFHPTTSRSRGATWRSVVLLSARRERRK